MGLLSKALYPCPVAIDSPKENRVGFFIINQSPLVFYSIGATKRVNNVMVLDIKNEKMIYISSELSEQGRSLYKSI